MKNTEARKRKRAAAVAWTDLLGGVMALLIVGRGAASGRD